MALLLQVGVLIALYVSYRTIISYLQTRHFKAFAKQHNCQEPLDITKPIWYRFTGLRRIAKIKETGEDIIDDIIADNFSKAFTAQGVGIEGSRNLLTIEPANIQAILATQFKDFETGLRRYQQLGSFLGRGIFTSDGAFWEHSRALFRPQFSRENINDLESTGEAVDALIKALGPVNANGWTGDVDMQPLFFNFTLDTATEFLFGESVNSQAVGMGGSIQEAGETMEVNKASTFAASHQFTDDLALIGDTTVGRIRLGTLYWLNDGFEFRRAVKRVRRFTEYFVQRAIDASKEDGGKTKSNKDTLLARLTSQTQDVEELRNQALALLFAGRDTTASLLGWTFMRLTLHRDIFTKLREIILREFVPGEPVPFAKLKGCRYLQHFLNEVQRLHPVVPFNNRIAAKDTTLPVGGGPDEKSPVVARKGQTVNYSVYFMHRRKDLWGEDALEFKPERWEQKIPARQFLPFNGGPRICLGQQFALTEASFLVVRLLQRFDRIEPVDRTEMLRFRKAIGITMWPGDGVKVRLHET